MGLILESSPGSPGEMRALRDSNPALLHYLIGRHARPADYLSDRFGELGERRGDPQYGTGVDADVVVGGGMSGYGSGTPRLQRVVPEA